MEPTDKPRKTAKPDEASLSVSALPALPPNPTLAQIIAWNNAARDAGVLPPLEHKPRRAKR